jgi:hypothetical protein
LLTGTSADPPPAPGGLSVTGPTLLTARLPAASFKGNWTYFIYFEFTTLVNLLTVVYVAVPSSRDFPLRLLYLTMPTICNT